MNFDVTASKSTISRVGLARPSTALEDSLFRYGIDAPGLVRGFFLAALGLLAVALLVGAFVPPLAQWGVIILAGYPFGMGCLMLYESLVWKLRLEATGQQSHSRFGGVDRV